jgi:6-pyruvoyltetrahydropterin/6-carboxytetrahydropterin synthase
MRYRISKSWNFAASHTIDTLPEGHKCKRLHGHTYTVTLELSSEKLDEHGFVVDFAKLDAFGDWVSELDHRHLNDVLRDTRLDNKAEMIRRAAKFTNPTCENLADWILSQWKHCLPQLVAVRVSESPTTWAEVRL